MSIFYKITKKKLLYIFIDTVIIASSYLLSYFLRYYPDLNSNLVILDYPYFLLLIAVYLFSLYICQIYRIIWYYSNIRDVYRLTIANSLSFILFFAISSLFDFQYTRSINILTSFFILFETAFYRVFLRDYFSKARGIENGLQKSNNIHLVNILIVGAGEAGRTILSEFYKKRWDKNIIGFVDDDPDKVKKIFNGKMVFGTTYDIDQLISKYNIKEIIIAIPSADHKIISRIAAKIHKKQNVSIKILPPLIEILNEKHLIQSLRNIGISDLIGREEVKVDFDVIEQNYKGKIILVTGGGGSIGSELSSQLVKFGIKKLIALGHGEFAIYNLSNHMNNLMQQLDYKTEIVYKIADIKDIDLCDTIFEKYKPNIIFHTAAHKHVPLMEFNELEALKNNVLGTLNMLKLAHKHNVEKFIMVSSDKAVNPVNIMGATKRIAELLTLYYYHEMNLNTAVVRFGNVIDSRGSVIPLFKEQIRKGGPITVTHPNATRYFMTIPEASILVIRASALEQGGKIFVLNMGKQYKIVNIAKNLIKFYGNNHKKDIKIVFTGLRPGEKLSEDLIYNYNKKNLKKTMDQKIFILDSRNQNNDKNALEKFINDILSDMLVDPLAIRKALQKVIKEYAYSMYECLKE